jgi:hypothetical protein
VKNPVLDAPDLGLEVSDNASGADNQQERPSIAAIPPATGYYLAGFAHGEGSFIIACRRRADYVRGWKISAAFNVSQADPEPLVRFRETFGCGSIRRGGNNGWYFEVNHLGEIGSVVIPFFERFPLMGAKAGDFQAFRAAVHILSRPPLREEDYVEVLRLREGMNHGGKRRHTMEGILRDYTPNSPSGIRRDEIVRSHGRP